MSPTPWSPPPHRALPASGLAVSLDPPLNYYLSVIRRGKWKILGAVGLALALTYGVSRLIQPLYEATVTIEIDPGVPAGVLGAEAQSAATLDADQFMATQVKLIQSDSVLRPIEQRRGLRRLEHQNLAAGNPSASAIEGAPITLRQLRVNRPPNTFLLQVSYRSPDPQLSAAVANEIAESYVQHTWDLRYASAVGLSTFMARQLGRVRSRMEQSSSRLAAFERDLNVADPEQKTAILTSRLVQLNNDYAAAQAARLQKEAAFNSIRNGSLEAAQASSQGEALKKIGERLNEAQARFAVTRGQFGRNFPEYKKAASEVEEIQSQLDQARANIAKRVEIEFREAANRESMLNDAVNGLKREFDGLHARSFDYQILKRDAETDRKLYDELEQKIYEAEANAGFRNSAIHIADAGRAPLRPASPDLRLNLLLALGFSLVGSMMVVIATDRRDLAVQDPENARMGLEVSVLGSLPLISQGGRPSFEWFMYDEAIGILCSTIALAPRAGELRSVAVMSALPGEGKTFTACNLATANARKGSLTLLIDADVHDPGVQAQLGLGPSAGLEEVLEGRAHWHDVRRNVPGLPTLDVITVEAGHGGLAAVTGQALTAILAGAAKEYDLIVIDSPPVLGFSSALEIAAVADGVLLLAVAGETHLKLLRDCIASLRQVGTRNLALVLNRITAANSGDTWYGNYAKQYKRYREVTRR